MRKHVIEPVPFFSHSPAWLRQQTQSTAFLHQIDELADSLEIRQRVPLIATPAGEVLDGNRRLMAAKRRGKPEKLEAILTDETLLPEAMLEIQLVTSLQHACLKPYELYLGLKQMQAALPALPLKDVAKRVGRNASWATAMLSLEGCCEEVKAAAEQGLITSADWYPISRFGADKEEQIRLLRAKLSGEISSREELVRQGRKARNGGERTAARTNKRVRFERVSGRSISISGDEDFSLEEAIEEIAELLAELKRGERQGIELATLVRISHDRSKAG